jgi:hypothetical protein
MMVDKRVMRLVHIDGFNQAFEEQIAKHKTMESAFHYVNELYAKYFGGEGKFKSYDSFRMSRNYHLKKHKNKS